MPVLATKEYCTGCTACASACPKGCITMVADRDGFKFPVVDKASCVSCGLCEKSCPVVSPLARNMKLPTAYAAYSKDRSVRMQSSSGGLFTEVARIVLSLGGVVYGAAYDDNFRIAHICIEDEASLAALRGAKYAQSDLGDTFLEIAEKLNTGRLVMFSGTPCQVGGLKAYLGKEYENLIAVDFVCHSMPSPVAWEKYVASLGNIKSINLRAKDTGWSRYGYCHRIETEEGSCLIPNGQSIYMKLFVGDYINRESCANCQFKGYSRCSDLTIGDFWGIWDIASEMDDDMGTSVVLLQSKRGTEYFSQISSNLEVMEVSLEDASRQNQAMLKSSSAHIKRAEALELIRSGKIDECNDLIEENWESPFLFGKRLVKAIIRKLLRNRQ